ncbi:MAG TPA: VOC family protein [Candidatus Nanoarchaeia archaeon]|nr:VOC family protein [Candidatus Nanoarchaeia archaeon]
MQKITPCLWFDNNAEEAINFYTSIFKNSKIGSTARYGEASAKASGRPKDSVMTMTFQLEGQEFMALNGGLIFKFTPAISLFVHCKTEQEVDALFKKLSQNGEILMPLDKYPFSERYAFFKDQFGLSWQLMLSPSQDHITPALLFVNKDCGKAEAAITFYTKVFKNASIQHMMHYEKGEPGQVGTVKHASFLLEGQEFMAMDGPGQHQFTFTEAISFIVNCTTQEEIDYFWNKLSEGGQEVQCGWLKDPFGISWQVVPAVLDKMMQDPKKASKVMQALLQMKKLDIKTLEQAYEQQ